MRSGFAQIGYSLPSYIIKEMALLECPISFDTGNDLDSERFP